jgi:hypothetical protein
MMEWLWRELVHWLPRRFIYCAFVEAVNRAAPSYSGRNELHLTVAQVGLALLDERQILPYPGKGT